MEKGFNDQELADIMSEIENLEREMVSSESPEAAEIVDAPEEPLHKASSVLHELAQRPAESVAALPHKGNVVAPAVLSFKVAGQLTVHLSFEVNGQSVSLQVSDTGLSIETETGAKFTVPLTGRHEAAKKAA